MSKKLNDSDINDKRIIIAPTAEPVGRTDPGRLWLSQAIPYECLVATPDFDEALSATQKEYASIIKDLEDK